MNIGLIVLGLAFLFFLVVAYFASKTWHWGHVVVMAFLFLFTLLFLFLTATLMRTHNTHRPRYAKAMQDYERELQREAQLRYGDPSTPAGEGTLMGERRLARVQQTTFGRTWGNVFAQVPQQGPIVLDMRGWSNEGCQKADLEGDEEEIEPIEDETMSGDDATAEDGEAPVAAVVESTHGIIQGQYLYAFHEYPVSSLTPEEKAYYFGIGGLGGAEFTDKDKKKLCRVPGAYLGKYFVKEAMPQRLIVEPADRLTPGQGQQLPKRLAWVLYEKLPTDTHELFAMEDAAKKQATLPALLPFARFGERGIPISPAAHQAMLQEYLRDGQNVGGEVPPLRQQQEIEFTKPYEQQVDLVVDGELPDTDRPFNADGRAQMKSVMLGGPAKFEQGTTVTVDGLTAGKLRQEGVANLVGTPKYSRQLRDYQFMLNDFQTQFNVVAGEKAVIQDQVDDLTASLKRLQEQIDKHVAELELLRADRKGFEIEKEQLEAYRSILEQRLGILQGEIQSRSFVTR